MVKDWFGPAMCEAAQPDRSNMPFGMLRSQKDMGSPNVCTSNPLTVRKCAVADSPYGPAPMIATSHFVIFRSPNLEFRFDNRTATMQSLAKKKIVEQSIYHLGRGKLVELLPQ